MKIASGSNLLALCYIGISIYIYVQLLTVFDGFEVFHDGSRNIRERQGLNKSSAAPIYVHTAGCSTFAAGYHGGTTSTHHSRGGSI